MSAVKQCFQYFGKRSWRESENKVALVFNRLRTQLRGGAGGKAAKTRKKQESSGFAGALIVFFFEFWLQQSGMKDTLDRPAKRRHVTATSIPYPSETFVPENTQNNDQPLAKQFMAVLKQSLNRRFI